MRRWSKVVSSLLVVALLAGCGGSASQPGAAGPGDSAAGGATVTESNEVIVDGEVVATKELVAAAEQEGTVTIYTSQAASDEQMVMDAFMKAFPKISVQIVRQGGGKLYEKFATEFRAGQHEADVILFSDLALMEEVVKMGAVAEHIPPSDDKYAPEVKKQGIYYTVTMPTMYFIYNHELIKPEEAPKTWHDLLDPKWKGKIGMTPAGIGGTAWTLAYFHRKELGKEYWEKLAAQEPVQYTGGAGLAESVARGELPIGILPDVTDFQVRVKQGAPITAVFPTEGAPVVLYTIAVAKNAPHPNAARLLMNWYLSPAGQKAIANVRGGYSARDDLPEPEGKPAKSTVKLYVPNTEEIISFHDEWVEEWNQVFNYR